MANRDSTGRPASSEAWDPPPPPSEAPEEDLGWAGLLGETTELASEWSRIQTGFVDEPRRAVEEADTLVATVIRRLADSFAAERALLEEQWSDRDEVDTEQLRVALRRYRTFFNQLLAQ